MAKASALLTLNIALIVLNGFMAWRPKHAKDQKEPKGTRAQHVFIALGASVAIVISLLKGADWCAKLFSTPPVVLVKTKGQVGENMPDCTLEGVGVVVDPDVKITSLEMIVFYPHPIYGHAVGTLRENIHDRTRVDWPCEIRAQSAERNNRLSFTVASSKQEMIIRGHDFTRSDAQQVLLAFYPIQRSWGDVNSGLDWTGDATYEAFGRELPATIRWRRE